MNGSSLSAGALLLVVLIYFLVLFVISYLTSRKADTQTFFNANKKSPWLLVAFGMIGASLSGVTFISIPGVVGADGFNQSYSYLQTVLGYVLGYAFIALVLMPIYYKKNLISIYTYLEDRFGPYSYKMGTFYFFISRILGASFRLYIVVIVLHPFVLEPYNISFEMTTLITLLLIWFYTYKGGIKTVVWTDTLQTAMMLSAVVFSLWSITNALDVNAGGLFSKIKEADLSQVFFFEGGWSNPNYFFKHFLAGALIAIAMTGLNQDMMQKNLTCRDLPSAQKNVFVFSIILVIANIIFLTLGASLYVFAAESAMAMPEKTDLLYPTIAFEYMSPVVAITFLLGLIAAAYSSADSTLTSLTTSYCVDILGFQKKELPEESKRRTRLIVHITFTIILFLVIVIFDKVLSDAVINNLLKVAGYTYGPLLGLFFYGIFTKWSTYDRWVPVVALLSPLLTYVIDSNSAEWFGGVQFGHFILAVNGLITFCGLWILKAINSGQKK